MLHPANKLQGGIIMSLINKEVSDFKVYAYHQNDFKFVSKEDLLGKWSVIFF